MLSYEQCRFLAARTLTNTDKDAAQKAGIPVGTAYSWRSEPEYSEAYQRLGEDGLVQARQYLDHLLGRMCVAYDEALDAVRVTPAGETVPDHKVRLAAAELIGKIAGLFVVKTEISGPDGRPLGTRQPPMDLSMLTDEELRIYERIAAKLEGKPSITAA